MQTGVLAILLFVGSAAALCAAILVVAQCFGPRRTNPAKQMPYESGMNPIHDARRRFDFRFYLLAVAFLVFDVELLFLYPWAVTGRSAVAGNEPGLFSNKDDAMVRHSEQREESAKEETLRFARDDKKQNGDGSLVATRKSGQSPANPPPDAGCRGNRHVLFSGVMVFMGLLVLGLVYDWRKGVFRWR